MLTAHAPREAHDRLALLTVVDWLRALEWERVIVAICSAFHFGIGVVVVRTEQYRWWAIAFWVATIATALLAVKVTVRRQLAAWYLVIPLGFIWSGVAIDRVINGEGLGFGVVFWPTVTLLWGIAAIRLAVGSR